MPDINKEIDRICFASLVLDHVYKGYDGLPPLVCCRVLVDGNWTANLYAETVEEAKEKFRAGTWKKEE